MTSSEGLVVALHVDGPSWLLWQLSLTIDCVLNIFDNWQHALHVWAMQIVFCTWNALHVWATSYVFLTTVGWLYSLSSIRATSHHMTLMVLILTALLGVPRLVHVTIHVTTHIISLVLACSATSEILVVQIVLHMWVALHDTDGPFEALGGLQGPLLKRCVRLAIWRSHHDQWVTWACARPF